MTEEEAFQVMQPMAVRFPYTDEAFDQWMGLMQELQEPAAAARAAWGLIKGSSSAFVPAWSAFEGDYSRWVRRVAEERAEEQHAIDTGSFSRTTLPSFEEGVKIAYAAYEAECFRQGRPPNKSHFDAWMGQGRADRRAALRGRRRT